MAPVPDAALLPARVKTLLQSEPGSREWQGALDDVIRVQVARVAQRFAAGEAAHAEMSMQGAMALARPGELRRLALGPQALPALRALVASLAARGDEGRARAAYELLAHATDSEAERADAQQHIEAIAAWTRAIANNGPLQSAGAHEVAAVARYVFEPSQAAREEAVRAVEQFVQQAVAVREARRTQGAQVTREEGLEAVRALETGAFVLIALHIRSADLQGARRAAEAMRDRVLVRPELVQLLDALAAKPTSARWLELAHALRSPLQRQSHDDDDFGRDSELLRTASFVAAIEAYRLEPTSAEASLLVATALVSFGLQDAAPAVVAEALAHEPHPRAVAAALATTLAAIERSLETSEPATARLSFAAASPLLATADARGPTQPSSAQVYAVMGEVEMREGNLEQARTLLSAAQKREKNGHVQLLLARLDWHEGNAAQALERLRGALDAPAAGSDAGLRGDVALLRSDIVRDQGNVQDARHGLENALRDLARARSTTEGDRRARIERLIARALDRLGADAKAKRALERAFAATPRDKPQIAATVGQMVARSLVASDLAGAREALSRAAAAELSLDDLVYYALWVRLIERQRPKAAAAGLSSAERVLLEVASDPRWLGRIAAFGVGKIGADDLQAAAQTPTQKTEALFYAAMGRRIAGDTKGASALLRQVVSAPGVDLMEASIARDMLRVDSEGRVAADVPADIDLP